MKKIFEVDRYDFYEAEDGKTFDNKEDCIRYEEHYKANFQKINHLMAALEEIQDICKADFSDCNECPFYMYDCGVCMFRNRYPAGWDLIWRNKE